MRLPVRFIGHLVARQIERRSLAVAAVGASAGAGVGIGLVRFVEYLRDEPILIHPVTAGILGGFVGVFVAPAVWRPAGGPDHPQSRPRGTLGAVRLTNYNAALGRIISSVLFCAAVGGLLYFALIEQAEWAQAPSIAASAAAAVAGAAFLSSLPMLWVDISDSAVTVRRLFGSRTYARDDIRRWGFATPLSGESPAAPSGHVPFVVELLDGRSMEVVVSRAKAIELEAVIAAPAGRTASPAPQTSSSPPPVPRP